MLISETTKIVVEISAAVSVIVGVFAAERHVRGRRRTLPTAIVRARWLPGTLRLLPLLGVPLGIIGYLWASGHSVEVLVVRDGKSLRYGNRVLEPKYGRAPLEFPVAAGDHEIEPLIGKPCWTVNLSSKPIRRLSIAYPSLVAHFVEKEAQTILPGERASLCEFDFYGNDYGPSETLEFATGTRFDTAWWLTWEARDKNEAK